MTVQTAHGRLATGDVEVRHGAWNLFGAFGIGDISDDGLGRLRRQYQRDLEDIADGLATPRESDPRNVQRLEALIRDIDGEATLRETLRYCGARENGTHSYADYDDAGGMKLHVAEDGTRSIVCDVPPSYPLALMLDYRRHRDGGACVLDWAQIEKSMGGREKVTQVMASAWLGGIA